jgi:hypothetical protein
MRYALVSLLHNLVAGLRLVLFMRVDRGAFRIGLAPWLLMIAFSATLDVLLDGLRTGPDARLSLLGLDGELFALGLLMLTSGVIAVLFRDVGMFVALPIVTLASFPLLQVVHAAPAIADIELPAPWDLALELAIVAWMIVVSMRAVRVVSEAPASRRTLRAIGGGLLLSLPLWFAPLAGPTDSWWSSGEPSAGGDGGSNPASEPVMAAQSFLLDHAIDDLEDERAGVTDLYYVGFAPDSRHDGFRDELDMARHALDERFGTQGRSLSLLNNRDTVAEVPYATLTNLRRVLLEIGDMIDADEDVVMVYVTGGATSAHGLAAVLPPLDLVALTPAGLKQILDTAGIRFRVVVVSTCAAGAWVEALQDDDTAVFAWPPGDAQSIGCEGGSAPSAFATALFDRALRSADSLPGAFDQVTQALVAQGLPAPQLVAGTGIEQQLVRIRRSPVRTALQ